MLEDMEAITDIRFMWKEFTERILVDTSIMFDSIIDTLAPSTIIELFPIIENSIKDIRDDLVTSVKEFNDNLKTKEARALKEAEKNKISLIKGVTDTYCTTCETWVDAKFSLVMDTHDRFLGYCAKGCGTLVATRYEE